MEKIIKKLHKLLSKAGLDESKIEEIISEVESSKDEPEVVEESAEVVEGETEKELPVDEPAEAPIESEPAESVAEPEVDGEPVEQAVEPEAVESEPIEESKDPNEINPADLIPSEEAPTPEVEPSVEPIPQEPDQSAELQSIVEEQSKTIEGLLSRISSLESALKESGILTEESTEEGFGLDSSKVPANEPADDPMASVLDRINGRRY